MPTQSNDKLAVLIDADNAQPSIATELFAERNAMHNGHCATT
jgi:hypothetical protein